MNTKTYAKPHTPVRLADPGDTGCDYNEFLHRNLPHIDLNLDAADETWVQFEKDQIVGHFSLWYRKTPPLKNKRVGFIGHYYAKNASIGASLLKFALQLLKRHGCQLAAGPIDGNTWRRYRLVCATADMPRFLMEPDNPLEYPAHFIEAGFETIATYSSSILDVKPGFLCPERMNTQDKANLAGVKIRAIDSENFEGDLRTIYRIACDAFKDNFLYSEISEFEFINRYQRIKHLVIPEMVLIAEYEHDAVGFALSIPDPANSNEAVKTAILKTVGRIDDNRFKGLGLSLISQCHDVAERLGFARMIHALYKDDNVSSSFSATTDARVFRRYAVYGHIL